MFKNASLRMRFLVPGVVLTFLPLLILTVVVSRAEKKMEHETAEECRRLAFDDLDHIAAGVYAMCETQNQVLQQNVDTGLNVTKATMARYGDARLGDRTVTWDCVNQCTKAKTTLTLPRMLVGDRWLGQNRAAETPSPLVDEVRDIAGGTSTVFQRMNEAGDMLRVCTNVIKGDGTRAVGTYIPVVNPDGKRNPVIASVLAGRTYRGRAFVVDRWYLTAYEPIRGDDGEVLGISYFGVPLESADALRSAIMKTKVGKSGYVYVLDSEGNYVISKDGKRDGENIWKAKDADGVAFIEEICTKAGKLGPGEVAEQRYPWQNKGEEEPRMKVARLMYYAPWDWVIGAGSYVDEFEQAEQTVRSVSRSNFLLMAVCSLLGLVFSVATWWYLANRVDAQFTRVTVGMRDASEQVASAATQVASASEQLAEGAGNQAASLQNVAASLTQINASTDSNANNARESDEAARHAYDATVQGVQAMSRMTEAIGRIKSSSDETARILQTIDSIAFQTNLLALNAAVEAARAGDAGRGFAVVAEEVRNLAQRSAEAAQGTAQLISDAQGSANDGVNEAQEVGVFLKQIEDNIGQVSAQIGNVAQASREQSQGVDAITRAVTELESLTQANAASAEESAAASGELRSQATQVDELAQSLALAVKGHRGVFRGAGPVS